MKTSKKSIIEILADNKMKVKQEFMDLKRETELEIVKLLKEFKNKTEINISSVDVKIVDCEPVFAKIKMEILR